MKNNLDKSPTTWVEFEELIISIFSPFTFTETEDKWKKITYGGSVAKVIWQVSQVLSEREMPTKEQLIKLVLQCFLKALWKPSKGMHKGATKRKQ